MTPEGLSSDAQALLRAGDTVTVLEGSRQLPAIQEALEAMPRRGLPPWLEVDKTSMQGSFKVYPSREEMNLPVQEHLIVEFYSK